MGAWTTAAVKNYSMNPPKEPASALDYMPSHRDHSAPQRELTEEELDRVSDYNLRVAELAVQMRAQANG